MTTATTAELLAAIRQLPRRERQELVEAVLKDLEVHPHTVEGSVNVIGLFSSDEDAAALDQVVNEAMQARRHTGFKRGA